MAATTMMWFRRDLRIADHPAMLAAVEPGLPVVALFVLDPRLALGPGANRLAFLLRCLAAMRSSGVPLIVRVGAPEAVVPLVAAEVDAGEVFVSADFSPFGTARDERVRAALDAGGRRLTAVGSPYVVEPGTVLTKSGTPFQVFTPFHRGWLDHAAAATPFAAIDPAIIDWVEAQSDGLPREPSEIAPDLPDGGEAAAWARWMAFRDRHLDEYADTRNTPALDATSRLSADLKFGTIHPRQLMPALRDATPTSGAWVFRSELAWREFYAEVLWRRPDTVWGNYLSSMDGMRVDGGPTADARFEAWCQGRTGYPFVDAGMRQLLTEGWVHNRVRMVVASFLVKDLHLPWQRGAAWFMRHLVDGDVASNQHGWQWTAGTGTDAAPYFRIFNPITQGRTYDPDGEYIRRYVGELRDFTGDVHDPFAAAKGRPVDQSLFDGPGLDYPRPIVDHSAERDEALARLAALRNATSHANNPA